MARKLAIAVCALALMLGTAASAQERVTGRVKHVEPASRIIHFADGRIVHLSDNAVITVNGRNVTFDQVQPGMTVVLDPRPAAAPGSAVIVAPGSSVVVADAWAGHPPVDASGVVASVDPASNTITFQDGRTFRLMPGTRVWSQGRMATVRPGDQVFVSGGQPIGYRSVVVPGQVVAAPAPAPGTRQYMGTVVAVEPDKTQVLLSDGRIVRVSPTTRMTWNDRPMTLAQLRPGDQLVVTVADPAPTAAVVVPQTGSVVVDRDAPSAFPRGGQNVVLDALDIKIMRTAEAP